jgi:hypothetical protein
MSRFSPSWSLSWHNWRAIKTTIVQLRASDKFVSFVALPLVDVRMIGAVYLKYNLSHYLRTRPDDRPIMYISRSSSHRSLFKVTISLQCFDICGGVARVLLTCVRNCSNRWAYAGVLSSPWSVLLSSHLPATFCMHLGIHAPNRWLLFHVPYTSR